MASGAVLFAGVITLLNTLDMITKPLRMVVIVVLAAISLGLAWLDYKSIADPVAFMEEKERRYEFVIQRLKDLREAQFAYKTRYNKYCNNIDSLMIFLKTDSLMQIKADGFVPDTMTEAEALAAGVYSRDTLLVPVAENVYDSKYLQSHHGKFYLDSLIYIPFTNQVKFKTEAGVIDRNGVDVQVFQITDMQPFDENQQLQIGSMTSPSTSGNWE